MFGKDSRSLRKGLANLWAKHLGSEDEFLFSSGHRRIMKWKKQSMMTRMITMGWLKDETAYSKIRRWFSVKYRKLSVVPALTVLDDMWLAGRDDWAAWLMVHVLTGSLYDDWETKNWWMKDGPPITRRHLDMVFMRQAMGKPVEKEKK